MRNRRKHDVLSKAAHTGLFTATAVGMAFGLASGLTGCKSWSDDRPTNKKFVAQGDEAYKVGDYSAAAASYEQAAEIKPASKLTQHNLGQTRLQLGQPVAAELAFRNGLAVSYDDIYWRVRFQDALAESLFQQTGQQDQLFSFLQDQVDTYGSDRDYQRQGDYLVRMGDVDNARVAYEGAAKASAENDATCLVALGDFYRSVGDDEEARLAYRYAYWVDAAHEGLGAKLRQTGFYPGPTAAIEPPDHLKPSGPPKEVEPEG